ncbi:hypothetical protein CIPAW_07G006800 [Carya illinoinensis]|nr:hypothetical protein CIPAW_07G006800 [Carya illinoinensis]
MVAELDITDQDVTRIADMIDGEIVSLVPEWRPGPGIEETPRFSSQGFCHNCASNHTSSGSLMDFLSHNQGIKNLQVLQCCKHGCAASMHGRFEEITFQAEESEHHVTVGAPNVSNQSDCLHHQEIQGQRDSPELGSVGSGPSHSCEEYEKLDQSTLSEDEKEDNVKNQNASKAGNLILSLSGSQSSSLKPSLYCDLSENFGKEIEQELRWLKAKYQMELRGRRDQRLGLASKPSTCGNRENNIDDRLLASFVSETLQADDNRVLRKSPAYDGQFSSIFRADVNKSCPNSETQLARNCKVMKNSSNPEDMVTAKGLHAGLLLPQSLHRTVSLPVDAVDI